MRPLPIMANLRRSDAVRVALHNGPQHSGLMTVDLNR